MPKQTFYKISDEKRKRMTDVGINIFSNQDFESVEVKHVVSLAQIPRGSFYAYFEDLEDYYAYIINQLQEKRIQDIEGLMKHFQGDFFSFLIHMYQYDLSKTSEPQRKLLQHHYLRYIQTIKKGSLTGTMYHLDKRRNIMSILTKLPLVNDQGMSIPEPEKHFVADFCMTIYLSTYNQATQEKRSLSEHLDLFKKRIKIIEKGVKSC